MHEVAEMGYGRRSNQCVGRNGYHGTLAGKEQLLNLATEQKFANPRAPTHANHQDVVVHLPNGFFDLCDGVPDPDRNGVMCIGDVQTFEFGCEVSASLPPS